MAESAAGWPAGLSGGSMSKLQRWGTARMDLWTKSAFVCTTQLMIIECCVEELSMEIWFFRTRILKQRGLAYGSFLWTAGVSIKVTNEKLHCFCLEIMEIFLVVMLYPTHQYTCMSI